MTPASQCDVHLLLYLRDVLVADCVCLGSAALDYLLDQRPVVLVLRPPLPHRLEQAVETGVHQLLAGNASDRCAAAHGGDVLGLSGVEGLVVLVQRTHIRVAGRLDRDSVGVGDGVAHLVPDLVRSVGQIDRVAKALAHLRVSVKSGKTRGHGELSLRDGDLGAVHLVEVPHEASGELHVGKLVLSNGYQVRVAECYVGALADRVAQEAVGELGEVV